MQRSTTIYIRFTRRLQLGQPPSNRQDAGLPPPPTMPFLQPQTFKMPKVVKIAPTTAGGSHSENAIILLMARVCAGSRRASDARDVN